MSASGVCSPCCVWLNVAVKIKCQLKVVDDHPEVK